MLFAVTAQYDGDARWKDIAAGLRDSFARAAANAKVGNDATYPRGVGPQTGPGRPDPRRPTAIAQGHKRRSTTGRVSPPGLR